MATKPEIRGKKYLLPKAVRCMELIASGHSKARICTLLRISPAFYDRVYHDCGFSEAGIRERRRDAFGKKGITSDLLPADPADNQGL